MLSEIGVTIHDIAEHASLPVERVKDSSALPPTNARALARPRSP